LLTRAICLPAIRGALAAASAGFVPYSLLDPGKILLGRFNARVGLRRHF